jgi:hypothetical protein
MRDVYVAVPHGTHVYAAADDFDRVSMAMAGVPASKYKIVNVDLLEEGD